MEAPPRIPQKETSKSPISIDEKIKLYNTFAPSEILLNRSREKVKIFINLTSYKFQN